VEVWIKAQTPLIRFVVDLLYNKLWVVINATS